MIRWFYFTAVSITVVLIYLNRCCKWRYFREDGGGLFALKLESGEPAWTAEPECEGPGPVVVDGVLYINSGYPMPRGVGGNVLLAFQAP